MTSLRENILFYLAALFTLSALVFSVVLDAQCCAPTRYLAPVFGASALVLMIWPMFTLRRYGQSQPGNSYMQATTIVDQDLYAVVRHPQYLGYMCLNMTFMLVSPHWLIILLGSLAIVLFYLIALQEEKHLIRDFGRAYQEYMGRAPRFNIISGLVRSIDYRGKG